MITNEELHRTLERGKADLQRLMDTVDQVLEEEKPLDEMPISVMQLAVVVSTSGRPLLPFLNLLLERVEEKTKDQADLERIQRG